VKSGFRNANSFAFRRLNALSSAKGIKAPNTTGLFLFTAFLAMKYLQSSTVKPGFRNANSFAFRRLNALSSAKGTGFKNATNVAFFRLSNPELREGEGFRNANSFAFRRLNGLSSAKGIKAPNTTGLFLFTAFLAMKYLQSSAAKAGLREANNSPIPYLPNNPRLSVKQLQPC